MHNTPILDKLDQKLIQELFRNSRASNSELGKKLLASKEVINYRISRLLNEGIIKKIIPLVNYSRLGYTIYRIQLKFNFKDKEKWPSFFKTIPQTSWMVELQGNWDLVVLFWIKNNLEFFQIVNKIKQEFGANTQEMLITMVDSIYNLPPNFLSEQPKKEPFYYKLEISKEPPVDLDELDFAIIKELMGNGRIPILELARKIHSSATNVNYHLSKLIKNKVIIAFIPVIDHTKLGLTHFKITLNLVNPAQKNQLKEFLLNSQSVIYITESYGSYDLEFEVITWKINDLFNLLEQISIEMPIKKHEIIYDNKEIMVNEMPVK